MTEHEELILELRRGFAGLREEVTGLRGEIRNMNEKMENGFRVISNKFDGLGKYLIAMDRHVDNHESRISELEKKSD